MQPNQNGDQYTGRPGWLTVSISQPNKIMAMFAPAIASSAPAS